MFHVFIYEFGCTKVPDERLTPRPGPATRTAQVCCIRPVSVTRRAAGTSPPPIVSRHEVRPVASVMPPARLPFHPSPSRGVGPPTVRHSSRAGLGPGGQRTFAKNVRLMPVSAA